MDCCLQADEGRAGCEDWAGRTLGIRLELVEESSLAGH
jgi:hypothetical protein